MGIDEIGSQIIPLVQPSAHRDAAVPHLDRTVFQQPRPDVVVVVIPVQDDVPVGILGHLVCVVRNDVHRSVAAVVEGFGIEPRFGTPSGALFGRPDRRVDEDHPVIEGLFEAAVPTGIFLPPVDAVGHAPLPFAISHDGPARGRHRELLAVGVENQRRPLGLHPERREVEGQQRRVLGRTDPNRGISLAPHLHAGEPVRALLLFDGEPVVARRDARRGGIEVDLVHQTVGRNRMPR